LSDGLGGHDSIQKPPAKRHSGPFRNVFETLPTPMSRYWSDTVSRLTPYVPGEQPKLDRLVKLNTNENPYGPSPKALAAIAAAAGDSLRLYPDPNADLLKATIARRFGVGADEVFVGNGSDEVLAHVFLALLRHERRLRFPDITYSFYPVYAGLYGIDAETVPVDADFRVRVADYAGACGGIIIPNPNAPTGIALAPDEVAALAAAHPECVVVIDEAYVDFGGETVVPLIRRFPNLLVVQTLSKSRSLAGLRVGFAVGQGELIEALERVKNSFNSYPLGRLAQVGAVAAIEDEAWFDETRRKVIASRARLTRSLGQLGFDVLPSQANFVFASHRTRAALDLAQALRERRIIVRHFKAPRIDNHLRITIGDDAQCDALVAALREILS
jgi:histidinol-phosphate aminotransferase